MRKNQILFIMNTNFFIIFLKGFLYGILGVAPGFSGGVVAYYFGDYDKCLNIINNKDISITSLLYMLNLLLGFIFGVILLSRLLLSFYNMYFKLFKYFALIINILLLVKIIINNRFPLNKVFKLCLASILIIFISSLFNSTLLCNDYILFSISGIFYSTSKIIPGLSSTSLLINLGFYDDLLLFFSNPLHEYINNPFCWSIFIIVVFVVGYFLIKLLSNYKEQLKILVIIILIINIIKMFI